jgi:DNA polymerase-1
LGRRIRTAFIAGRQGNAGKRGEPNKLVSADYSQFELRLAAVMADDKELIDMFNRGADIHTATAATVYGRLEEDVTKSQRRAAKVINFGILYGMSPHGLSVATGMTREQAVAFIEKYKQVRRPLFEYIDRIREQARSQGYVETLLGRRRPTPDIHSSNFVVRQAAERAAINMPIQGTEADLMKMAMVRADKLLHDKFPGARQLMQVHDSILVEVPESQAAAAGTMLKETMEGIYKLPVKLDVDVTIGDNWGEL